MTINFQLKSLRKVTRQNSKKIIDHVIKANISRPTLKYRKIEEELCVFCGSIDNITKEHVVPRWAFAGNTSKFFTTDINELSQTYNKTTIPACCVCNNERLNSLEVYINRLFSEVDLSISHFDHNEMENIIRWLEIIDYKFQILNARRFFLTSKENGYMSYFADFPITVLRPTIEYSSNKAITEIRRSQKRITVKNKACNLNSLIVFKSSNKGFHFFHKMDDFIFLEFPQHKLAIFYFFKKTFTKINEGHKQAQKIIDQVY